MSLPLTIELMSTSDHVLKDIPMIGMGLDQRYITIHVGRDGAFTQISELYFIPETDSEIECFFKDMAPGEKFSLTVDLQFNWESYLPVFGAPGSYQILAKFLTRDKHQYYKSNTIQVQVLEFKNPGERAIFKALISGDDLLRVFYNHEYLPFIKKYESIVEQLMDLHRSAPGSWYAHQIETVLGGIYRDIKTKPQIIQRSRPGLMRFKDELKPFEARKASP